MSDKSRARRIGFPLGATLLIVLGFVFLLNNLGYLPWNLWGTLWKFWPVILILIGVNFFLADSRPWLMLVVTLIVLAGVFLAAWAMTGTDGLPRQATVNFSQPLGNAERAEVQIDFGAGRLTIGSLPPAAGVLASGEIIEGATRDFKISNGVAKLRLAMPTGNWWIPGTPSADFRIMLTRQVPLDLVIKTGANESEIDLTNLTVSSLTMDTGASRNVILMPANAGATLASIKAGAAELRISVPHGVAARIRLNTELSTLNIDQSRFPKDGELYISPGYSLAPNRLDLEVKASAASLTIK